VVQLGDLSVGIYLLLVPGSKTISRFTDFWLISNDWERCNEMNSHSEINIINKQLGFSMY